MTRYKKSQNDLSVLDKDLSTRTKNAWTELWNSIKYFPQIMKEKGKNRNGRYKTVIPQRVPLSKKK